MKSWKTSAADGAERLRIFSRDCHEPLCTKKAERLEDRWQLLDMSLSQLTLKSYNI